MTKDGEQFLKCLLAFEILLLRILFRTKPHFKKLDRLVFWCLVSWILYIFWRSVLCQTWYWWRSFPICRLPFCLIDHVLCLSEVFQFQKVPFINRQSQFLCYWCCIQEVVCCANVFKTTSHFLFYQVQCNWIYVEVKSTRTWVLCRVIDMDLFVFFYTPTAIYASTIWWRYFLFPIV